MLADWQQHVAATCLPEPDTPVTATSRCSGTLTSIAHRCAARRRAKRNAGLAHARRGAAAADAPVGGRESGRSPSLDWPTHVRRPLRHQPPAAPAAPGPMSMMCRRAGWCLSSCSTTTSVLPFSPSRASAFSKMAVVARCKPIVGSSST